MLKKYLYMLLSQQKLTKLMKLFLSLLHTIPLIQTYKKDLMIKKALISSNFQYSKTISNMFQKTKLFNNMSQLLNVSRLLCSCNLHHYKTITK